MRSSSRSEGSGKIPGMAILGVILFVLFAQLIYVLLAGGAFRELGKHDHPYNHPGSTWESTEPIIHLDVIDRIPSHGKAFLIVDGKEIPVELQMDDYSAWVDIYESSTGKFLLNGTGKFSSDRVLIQVKEDLDYIYNGKYSVITLYRTDTQ